MVRFHSPLRGIKLIAVNAELVGSPPPPYSPKRPRELQASASAQNSVTPSPSDTMSPGTDYSLSGTPLSAATAMSMYGSSPLQYGRRSPRSAVHARHGNSPATSSTACFPPPPPAGKRARSSSKNHADRLLSAITSRGKNANTSSPVNAIDSLHETTAQVLAGAPEALQAGSSFRPPGARRAASTGAIGLGPSTSRSSNVPNSDIYQTGMPLPPPPPGPPPAGLRSQSLCRNSEPSSSTYDPNGIVRNRHPPGRGTNLGAVPPTPADWRDEEGGDPRHWPHRPDLPERLQLDTRNQVQQPSAEDNSTILPASRQVSDVSRNRQDFSSGTLLRSPAVRNRSVQGIRERRNESRSGKARVAKDSDDVADNSDPWADALSNVKPTDLVLPTNGDGLLRRRVSTRSTPRSAKNPRGLDEILGSADMRMSSGQGSSFDSSYSTPRPESARFGQVQGGSTPTTPFSANKESHQKLRVNDRYSPSLPFKTIPTPPLQHSGGTLRSPQPIQPPRDEPRPVSHLLHTPNPDLPIEILPLGPESSQPLSVSNNIDNPVTFAQRAIERHRKFVESEAAAANDSQRLHLFTLYMLAESRIRRTRYSSTFDEEEINPSELVQGMFDVSPTTSSQNNEESVEPTTKTSVGGSRRSSGTSFADSHSRNASTTATSDVLLALDTSVPSQAEASRRNDYVPCLSPIASMSAVTWYDGAESRGRAPSRWWEGESHHSSHEDGFKVLERSKRESKYMGVPLEGRNIPAFNDSGTSQVNCSHRNEASTSQAPAYESDEYPPEKASWYEESSNSYPYPYPPTPQSAPYTPDPRRLDISRLVTLPPPFPRHHPAVNNSHPDLADIRNVVRSLNDLTEVESTRQIYKTQILEKRKRADSWVKHQRSLHSQDIQFRMENGEISQVQFDQAEADIEAKEAKSKKDITQATFDLFQNIVVSPLHALFTERINKATNSFDQLSSRLFSDAQSHSPNLPQEEGDEQPELLEKLTQLKWLFEARENLHQETYNLLSERNDTYKAIVLLSYDQLHDHEKLADAEAFFAKDAQTRKVAFESAALKRFDHFLSIIESHVTRGVEIQLSAFWDIAPPLLSLLQQIPTDNLQTLNILIPREELDETPLYWTYPLRYLYSLVSHAESSSRQFIESQVLLWCLLQEVREATMRAKWRFQESKGEVGWEKVEEREREKKAVLDDLKEKVGVVEGQWGEALGGVICKVKEGVKRYLEERGGWDEELEGV